MLSLSTNFSDVLERTGSPEVRPLIKMTGREIDSPYNTKDFYFSTQYFEITDSGTTYPVEGILQKTPKIKQKMNIKKAKPSIGGFNIALTDFGDTPFSENLANYVFYNRTIELYTWVEGLTDISDCLKVYAGIIREIKPKQSQVQFSVENSTNTVNKILPQTIINETDYPNAQDDSIGKTIPIVYGDHILVQHNTDPSKIMFNQDVTLVPMTCIDKEANKYIGADHAINEIAGVWVYDRTIGRFVEIVNYTLLSNSNVQGVFLTIDGNSVYDYWYPNATSGDVGVPSGKWTSTDQSADQDLATAAEFVNEFNNAWDHSEFDVDFPTYKHGGISDSDISEVRVFAKASEDTGDAGITWTINGADITGASSGTLEDCGTEAATKAGAAASTHVYIEDTADADPNVRYAVYEVFKRIQYTPTTPYTEFYLSCKGREDDGAGTITGTPGQLLESPSHIAESLARDELGLTTTFDTTAFDNVHTELSSWKLAPIFTKRKDSQAIFEKIGYQSKSFLWYNNTNQLSMDTFYSSETTDYTDISKKEIQLKSLKISTAKLKDLVNDLILKYLPFTAGNDYLKSITRADDTTDTGSQDTYNVVAEKEIKSDYINDATTAGLLADHYTQNNGGAFWSDVFPIVEFETADLRGTNYWQSGSFTPLLALELNDVITFDSTEWDSYLLCLGESWSGKQFKIFDITRTLTSLKIKAFQV